MKSKRPPAIPRRAFGDGFFEKQIQLIQIKLIASIGHGHRAVATITWAIRVVVDTGSRPTAEIYSITLQPGPTGSILARERGDHASRRSIIGASRKTQVINPQAPISNRKLILRKNFMLMQMNPY